MRYPARFGRVGLKSRSVLEYGQTRKTSTSIDFTLPALVG